jgi:hypothetical protein
MKNMDSKKCQNSVEKKDKKNTINEKFIKEVH